MWQQLLGSLLGGSGEKPGAASQQLTGRTGGFTPNMLETGEQKLTGQSTGAEGADLVKNFMQTDAFGMILNQLLGAQPSPAQQQRKQQLAQGPQNMFQDLLLM